MSYRDKFPLEHCEIVVSSTYHQSWIIDILAASLRRWGWKVTTGTTGFKATYQ